jgi:hypothetical protein
LDLLVLKALKVKLALRASRGFRALRVTKVTLEIKALRVSRA